MSTDQFFGKYNKTPLNVDGVYGNQCVDVFLAYNRDVVNGPPISGNAIDYWTKYPQDFYDKFINTPDAVPQLGDVVIWNVGKFGHIAIFSSGDVNSFVSFDQNWPSEGYFDANGNFIGTGKCHFQAHSDYSNVLGWLRPKLSTPIPTPMPPINDQTIIDMGMGFGMMEVQAIRSTLHDQANTITGLRSDLANALAGNAQQATMISSLRADLEKAVQTLKICQETPPTTFTPHTYFGKLFYSWALKNG